MIFTERTITVVNDSATINKPLILYRGDKNIELKITIAESQFKFRNTDASNVIETTDASYAQLVINTPYGSPIFSDVAVTKNGAVIFVITEAMIDEIREVGAYEIQIRLLDDNKQSRASIPPVSNAIEIREPIAIEDGSAVDSNAVNVAKVNRALTTTSAPLEPFDSQGNYIKKTWGDGDPITDAALNKMEAAIDGVNKKIGNNRSQIKEIENNKADKNEVIKKGYGTLNDFDEATRAVLQGLNPGQINAVLGEKNVTLENLSFSKILSKNLLNKNTIILNKEFNGDGSIIASTDKFISAFIPCKPNTLYSQYQIENNSNVDNRQYAVFYDSNKNIIKATDSEPWSSYTTPSNCSFIRTSNFLTHKETSMLIEGKFNPNALNASYEEYKIAISSDVVDLSAVNSTIGTLEEQHNTDLTEVNSKISALEAQIGQGGSGSSGGNTDNTDSATQLPEYWTTYLDDRINTIKNELCKPETFYAPVIFVTDSHYVTSNNVDAKIINYLDEKLPIAQVLHGGDFITIESTYLDCFNNLNMCVDKYKKVKNKFLPALGNHDCVSSGTSPAPFRKSQADEIIFKNLNEVNNVCKPNTSYVGRIYDILGNFGYYYKDDEVKKIRYIILNSCDNFRDTQSNDIGFAFKNEQVEWLASEALNFEKKGKGWRIVILSHLYTENSNINGSEGEGTTYNIEHVKGILNAYINKTTYTFNDKSYDFSQNDNKIVGYFCGHYHYPSLFKDGNLNVCVGLNADGHVYTPNGCTEIPRTKGTINETALEVLLIGTDNCKLFRIGAGEDRSFTF